MKKTKKLPSKYLDLLRFVTPCPDQHQGIWGTGDYVNSGTCHYMASCGAMEIIMNKEKGISGNEHIGGETDLSERWMINIPIPKKFIKKHNWITDRILVYNFYGRTMLERDYPYTKGYTHGRFSVRYNWKNDIPKNWKEKKSISVPKIRRKLLFGKCNTDSIYDVAVLNEKHINKIKKALIKYKSPVLVIYNGEETWHSVLIVGYDDEEYIGECKYVNQMIEYKELNEHHIKKLKKAIKKQGFRKRGVFYVRESEYYNEPKGFYEKSKINYDYGLDEGNEEIHSQPYVAPYCKRSYDWMKFLGNHAIVIFPEPKKNRRE